MWKQIFLFGWKNVKKLDQLQLNMKKLNQLKITEMYMNLSLFHFLSLNKFIGTMLDPTQVNFWQKCAAGRNKRYDKLLWISESIQPQRFAIDIFGCRRNKGKKASNVSSNSVKFPNPNETGQRKSVPHIKNMKNSISNLHLAECSQRQTISPQAFALFSCLFKLLKLTVEKTTLNLMMKSKQKVYLFSARFSQSES